MRILLTIFIIACILVLLPSFIKQDAEKDSKEYTQLLRKLYSQPNTQWPKPSLDNDIQGFEELDQLPVSPYQFLDDSLKNIALLGKVLFFDPRLSSSEKISCASCHSPAKHWTDGVSTSFGHDSIRGTRNSPTIQNSWAGSRFFWDGRSKNLADQAFGPINNEIEMNSSFPAIAKKLNTIKGYQLLFQKAFGESRITPYYITEAIALFEQTVSSSRNRFDAFVAGNYKALTDGEIRGLHLFRTKARCINCHQGAMFTDNQFHNTGLSHFNSQNEDVGYYFYTHNENDMGKFKTPSLRDVVYTGPWMHNGSFNSLDSIIRFYNAGAIVKAMPPLRPEEVIKPILSPRIRAANLTPSEIKDILSFLAAISAPAKPIKKVVLPV